jgi:hypothetical protein
MLRGGVAAAVLLVAGPAIAADYRWRPRIDSLIEGFRTAPDPSWLRWLEYIGL